MEVGSVDEAMQTGKETDAKVSSLAKQDGQVAITSGEIYLN